MSFVITYDHMADVLAIRPAIFLIAYELPDSFLFSTKTVVISFTPNDSTHITRPNRKNNSHVVISGLSKISGIVSEAWALLE
ncbi:hypothetical protein LOAG_10064 [Loa loa]|uniref:Uncharacterized protein n=1 Tax=Loa loa TaxID=7209 RepID=A0A1S0TS63_LOALO|nr:hypothetical protein LOAG_10064 [Loa loa]EFO18433.2 hypothetical protein LOAG_10064 [Loa loa]